MNLKTISLYLGLLALILFSCAKEQVNTNHKNKSAVSIVDTGNAVLKQMSASKAWIPDQSQLEENGGSIVVKAPQQWSYAGIDENGKLLIAREKVMSKISCTCNSNGACKPFVASGPGGSISGCGGDCTNCSMLQSVFMKNTGNNVVYSGGYFNKSIKTRILKDGESIPAVFEALFHVKEFQQELLALYKEAYRGKAFQRVIFDKSGAATAPEGYSLVGANIMGRGMLVVLPMEYVVKKLGYSVVLSASCGCSLGSCKLKDKSVLGVGAIWCDGNCTGTCTLNTSFKKVPNYSIIMSAYRY